MKPVNTGTYANNELVVYKFLTSTMGLKVSAACGILANMAHESSPPFNHTAYVESDGGEGPSYGLCMWHDPVPGTGRYTNLKKFRPKDYNTVTGQMYFLWHELKGYSSLMNLINTVDNTAEGADKVAQKFCIDFERPRNAAARAIERGTSAKTTYWNNYKSQSTGSVNLVENLGAKIIAEARRHIGKPYQMGGNGPDIFDCSGYVKYCYNTAINYGMNARTAYTQYSLGKKINGNYKAADLVFFLNTYQSGSSPNISHVGMMTGNGDEFIQASGDRVNISNLSNSYWKSHYYGTKRLLADSETGQDINYSDETGNSAGGSSSDTTSIGEYIALPNYDPYAAIALENLSVVEAAGFDYGYLIDLNPKPGHDRVFKFYIPEFSESAGANWEDVEISGRSVTIKAYKSTNSRSISISLDLYAGAGLYSSDTSEDIVGDMHKDINFVKSLEYPDYTNPIVSPPDTVQLILGSTINLVGVVSEVNVEHMKPLDTQNRSMYVKLSFRVTQTAVNPIDFKDVRNNIYVLPGTTTLASIIDNADTTNAPSYTVEEEGDKRVVTTTTGNTFTIE